MGVSPHFFQVDSIARPHTNDITTFRKVIAQSGHVGLGTTEGRWVTVDELSDVHWGLSAPPTIMRPYQG
jgi:hypothetical protein